MRRFSFFASLGSLATLGLTAMAWGQQFQPPTGYEEIPLVDSSDQPLRPDGLAISPNGEMAVTNGDTVTLYNTWQNGRTVIGSVTDPAWLFDTDPVFLNNSTILFGENGNTDALWSVNFSTSTPTQVTPNGSLPLQSKAFTKAATARPTRSSGPQPAST